MNHIFHELRIKARPSIIFKALSTKDGMEAWWPKIAGSNYTVGSEVQLFFDIKYDWKAEVILFDINRSIHFKLIKADADWTGTILKFDIQQEDDFSLLTLSHLHWKEVNHHFKRTNYCWAFYLKMIKDYAEQNIIVPFEDRSIF